MFHVNKSASCVYLTRMYAFAAWYFAVENNGMELERGEMKLQILTGATADSVDSFTFAGWRAKVIINAPAAKCSVFRLNNVRVSLSPAVIKKKCIRRRMRREQNSARKKKLSSSRFIVNSVLEGEKEKKKDHIMFMMHKSASA